MTFTLEKEYVYFGVTLLVLLIQLYNTYRMGKIRSEVDSIWQQIAIMAIASGGAFEKLEKKIDGKEDKK
jgi:hypothetical protein